MAATQFGPGASRPVIRGQGGPRVRVLNNGIDSFDAAGVSPDHAVVAPVGGARRIEVLRGPATLLYGSQAIGGVVNVIDGRIPDSLPAGGADGTARLDYGSGADELGGFAGIDAAAGGNLVVHGEAGFRNADDYRINGYASDEAREEGVKGRVENSALRNRNAAVGASWLGEQGYAGLSVSRFDSYYGVPGGHDHDDGGGEEEHGGVRIDMAQTRLDTKFGLYDVLSALEELRFRFGYADYRHDEIESSGEIGTRFDSDSWEGRIEGVHRPLFAGNDGVVGLQGGRRDFSATGEEAFLPANITDNYALFALERYSTGNWQFSLGGRIERQQVEADGIGAKRDFTPVSLSAGASYRLPQDYVAGLSLSRTERAPSAEELLSDGAHIATRSYEVGDVNLGKETAWTAELSLRKTAGDVTGGINLFAARYQDFIYGDFTGAEIDDLQELRYRQSDADFHGFEIEAAWTFFRGGGWTLGTDGSIDYVRASRRGGDPLPLIPPLGYLAGLTAETGAFGFRLEVDGVLDQDRNAANESRTDSYTLLNAAVSWKPVEGSDNLKLLLQGRNLTDAEGRNHVSLLKDEVPIRGREIRLAGIVSF